MLVTVLNKLYPTMEIINSRIVMAWLWKKISCSIRGELAFWKVMDLMKGIFKGDPASHF
jgi:hypothetical protein